MQPTRRLKDTHAYIQTHPNSGACRYAGRTFETPSQAAAGEGVLQIKGVKAIWRQSAPIVADTLQVRI